MNEIATDQPTDIGGISTNYSCSSILVHEIDRTIGHAAQMVMQGKRPSHKQSVLIRIEGPYHQTMGIDEDDIIPVSVAIFAAIHRGGGKIVFEHSPVSLKDLETTQLLLGDKGQDIIESERSAFLYSLAIGNYIAHHQLSEVIADNQKDDKAYVVNVENVFNVFERTFRKILNMTQDYNFDGYNEKLEKMMPDITGLRNAFGSEDLRDQIAMGLGRIIDTAPENCSANSTSGGGEYAS